MRDSGHFHCQDCGIAFESDAARKEHHRTEHSDQADGADGGDGGGITSTPVPVRSAAQNPNSMRKNKQFTRGHKE